MRLGFLSQRFRCVSWRALSLPPPRGKVPPKGADEGAMIERFFVGPDALIGPLDGSFRRGISPPAGGEFLCPWRQSNQNATGDGSDEHFVLIVAFPRTPLRGTRTCQVLQCFRRAKFEWLSAVQSGPLGPGYTKILTTALSELRLALPSQRSWCVSWREPQGAPLREIGSVSILL